MQLRLISPREFLPIGITVHFTLSITFSLIIKTYSPTANVARPVLDAK